MGHDVNKSSLRQKVADYLSERSDFYHAFVHQPVNSSDGMNAKNEPLDDEDVQIESLLVSSCVNICDKVPGVTILLLLLCMTCLM